MRIELDGADWRTIPVEVATRVGVWIDTELDRPRLRALGRELRRARALDAATAALAHRDLSARGLEERLGRRRVAPTARREAVETLVRTGYVDDERFCLARARTLAARGRGDASIRADLDRSGAARETIEEALAALEPESRRAASIVAERGLTPATVRRLARAGFSDEVVTELLERVVADGP